MSQEWSEESTSTDRPHKAGAYDVRNVIGGLIGFYGIVLLLVAIFGNDAGDKTGGVNANLWAGLGMVVFGIGFVLWSRLRPVVVAGGHQGDDITGDEGRPPGH